MKKRDNSGRRGNALIEFALASSTLILSFSGAFQFGFSFYRYNMLHSAVSAGARYGSLKTYRCSRGATDIDAIKSRIRNVVVYGTPVPDGNTSAIIPGLSTASVDVSFTLSSTGVPTYVTVGIRSFTIDAVFTQFTLTGKPYASFPFMGRYAPSEAEP